MINAVGNLGGYVGPFIVGWIKDSTGSFQAGLYFLHLWRHQADESSPRDEESQQRQPALTRAILPFHIVWIVRIGRRI
jgi:hypothetical protein